MNIVLFSEKDALGEGAYFFWRGDGRYEHIKKVLRLDVGASFKCGIIDGSSGLGRIEEFSEARLVFSYSELGPKEPLYPIYLVLGCPRPIQLRRILRDVASLGVAHIELTFTALGEKSYRESNLLSEESLKEYLLDGVMQSGRTALPTISLSDSVDAALSRVRGLPRERPITQFLVADIGEEAVPLKTAVRPGEPICVAIGSERGWCEQERRLFREKGVRVCSLGERILRTETATVSALSVVLSQGFWK